MIIQEERVYMKKWALFTSQEWLASKSKHSWSVVVSTFKKTHTHTHSVWGFWGSHSCLVDRLIFIMLIFSFPLHHLLINKWIMPRFDPISRSIIFGVCMCVKLCINLRVNFMFLSFYYIILTYELGTMIKYVE